jgi:hypothetical protein
MASSSAVKSRPPKPPGGEWVEYDQFIDLQIRKTRGQVKGVEVASALMTLAAGALAFFLVVAVFDHWVLAHGLGFWGRLLCFAMFLGGAGYYAADKLLPWLIYRINPIYAAQAIEKSRPTLKNSLINFLFLRGQEAPVPKSVFKAVEEQAAAGLSRISVESAVDRSRLIHIGYALLAVVGLFAVYFLFSPKSPWNTVSRVLMPWSDTPVTTRVDIIDIQPGTRTVFRGETVEVSAEIRGLKEDEPVPVRVVYSTADHEAVDQPVTMYQPPDRFRHSAKIPPAAGAAEQFTAGQQAANADSSEGVQQDIDYRIEAGDAVSPTYHLTAVTAPTIALESVDYQFPDYTGRSRVTLKGIGDIQALEGTRVVIHGRANQPIKSAQLELDGREGKKLPMQIADDRRTVTGSFTLALDEQDRTSPQFAHYRLRPEGREEPEPVQYRIDVIADLAPEVKFILPEKDEVALPVNGQLKLKLRALDPDFALSELTLSAEASRTNILDARLLSEIRREPMQIDYVIDPAKLHLKVDDVVEYWATAKDNRAPTPNATTTTRRRIRIVAAGTRQTGSSENQGDGNGEGKPGDNSDKNNASDKASNQDKPQGDAPNQDQPPADKQPGDKLQPNKSQSKSPQDQQADNKPGGEENQRPDASQNQPPDKPSQDQQQQNRDGGAKQQDPSQQKKSGDNQNSADQQDQNNKQDPTQQKSGDKQQKGGGGSNSSQQKHGQSGGKSDSSQGGSDSKSGGDNSSNDKSSGGKNGNDKSTDASQKNGGDSQNNTGHSGEKPTGDNQQNANPPGQCSERPASDGSDDLKALERILKHEQGNTKNGSQQNQQQQPSDQSQNSAGQKKTGDQQQPGGQKSDSQNAPDSQSKLGDASKPLNPQQKPGGDQSDKSKSADSQKPSGEKASDSQKPSDGAKPKDGEKTGDNAAGEKSQAGKSGTDKPKDAKPSGDQQSTKEGDPKDAGGKKDGANPSSTDKSNGANSTKEQSPTDKAAGEKPNGSKPADKSEKPDAQSSRDSEQGQNKSANGNKPDQGNGQRTNDGSQPTGDKHEAQKDGEKSNSKSGDADSRKGESGAGTDANKDDKSAPPAPQEANQPTRNKKEQPQSAGKKEMKSQDQGNSPTASPKESTAKGDPQDGSQSGGGGRGGGQGANQAGTGGPGKNTAADQGNGVAQGHGQGEDSEKAGTDKKSEQKTGQSGNEKGDGSHTQSANSDQANNPNSSQSQDANKPTSPSPQGSQSKNADSPSGPGGADYVPHGGGGSSGDPTGPPPPSEGTGDPANAEFAKKQFDLALESLKKGKPDLLKELNWTPEEAQKLAERLEQMRRNAEVPGAKGDEARQRLDEILHSLGARSGQLVRRNGGNSTDTQRGLHESHDAGPPPEYSEQFGAFQQGILQSGK